MPTTDETLTILPLHCPVKMDGDVTGKVLGTSIQGLTVRYEVGYWDNNHWQTVWFPSELVTPVEETRTVKIGFHT